MSPSNTLALATLPLLLTSLLRPCPPAVEGVQAGWADLRTPAMHQAGPEAFARGARLVDQLARRHGAEALGRHQVLEVTGLDRWPVAGPWWPQKDQRIRARQLLGTFTSRVELLDGPAAGEIWGIQSWQGYRQPPGEPLRLVGDDLAISFYLPTLHYFNELPVRLRGATVKIDGGVREHRGRSYRLVLVTWGSPEPSGAFDQYLLWIDQESGLLAMATYTVRDAVAMAPPEMRDRYRAAAVGTIHFRDWRDVGGFLFPFVQIVTMLGVDDIVEPIDEHFVHRFDAAEVALDTVPRSTLLPLPDLAPPADRKEH